MSIKIKITLNNEERLKYIDDDRPFYTDRYKNSISGRIPANNNGEIRKLIDENKESSDDIDYADKVVAAVKNHISDCMNMNFDALKRYIIDNYEDMMGVFDELEPLEPLTKPEIRPIGKKQANIYECEFCYSTLYDWLLNIFDTDVLDENYYEYFENMEYTANELVSTMDNICVGDVIVNINRYRANGMFIVSSSGKLEKMKSDGSYHPALLKEYTSMVNNPFTYWKDCDIRHFQLAADHPMNKYGRDATFEEADDEPIFEDPRNL